MSDEVKLDPKVYRMVIPRNVYKFVCMEAENTKSQKHGDRMFKLKFEFKDSKPINGVDINGLDLTVFSVIKENTMQFFNGIRNALGLNELTYEEALNADAKSYIGLEGYAIASARMDDQKNDVTGEVLIDPYTKEPLKKVVRDINEWIPRTKK